MYMLDQPAGRDERQPPSSHHKQIAKKENAHARCRRSGARGHEEYRDG